MKIWITTDTHLNHKKLIEYGRVADFEERITKGLKTYVRSEDLLIHLGDICIGNDREWSNWFKKELNCRTYLIRGNHDNQNIGWYLRNGWDVVADRLDIEMFGKRICFTHMPVEWDGHFDINLHGHFHDTDHRKKEPAFSKILSRYNELVALEFTNYQLVLLEKLIQRHENLQNFQ
jgi:calcineurin-like phosphoesterase family protein